MLIPSKIENTNVAGGDVVRDDGGEDLDMVVPPPYKVKVVEPITLLDPAGRGKAMSDAGYNTFLLHSDVCAAEISE